MLANSCRATLLLFVGFLSQNLSAIPSRLEPTYLKCLLLVREAKLDLALSKIDKLLEEDPNFVEGMQLKALVLRGKQRNGDARALYQKLLNQEKNPLDAARYHFELGSIAFEEKNLELATKHFTSSIRQNYNVSSSNHYLGILKFEQQRWEEAQAHFEKALANTSPILKVQARLYLTQVEQHLGNKVGAMRHQIEARQLSSQLMQLRHRSVHTVELAQQASELFQKAFSSQGSRSWLGSVGVLVGYDSNVLFAPDSTAETPQPTGSAGTSALRYSIGYSRSPVSSYEWLSTYSGAISYNSNPDTKAGQFFSHTVGTQVVKNPLSLTNYGAQLSISGLLQTRKDENGNNSYSPYSANASLGAFARWEMAPRIVLGTGAFFQPERNFLDGFLAETEQRSGWKQSFLVFLANVGKRRWWNPTVSFNLTVGEPTGVSLRQISTDLSFNNPMYLADKTALIGGLALTFRYFHSRPSGIRSDLEPSVFFSGIYEWSTRISLLGQVSYAVNSTNVASASYNRFTFTLGASYSI